MALRPGDHDRQMHLRWIAFLGVCVLVLFAGLVLPAQAAVSAPPSGAAILFCADPAGAAQPGAELPLPAVCIDAESGATALLLPPAALRPPPPAAAVLPAAAASMRRAAAQPPARPPKGSAPL